MSCPIGYPPDALAHELAMPCCDSMSQVASIFKPRKCRGWLFKGDALILLVASFLTSCLEVENDCCKVVVPDSLVQFAFHKVKRVIVKFRHLSPEVIVVFEPLVECRPANTNHFACRSHDAQGLLQCLQHLFFYVFGLFGFASHVRCLCGGFSF